MGKFAERTTVSVEKSRAEIDTLLKKHGATCLMSGVMPGRAMIAFEMKKRRLRFDLPLPDPMAREFIRDKNGYAVSNSTAAQKFEQACRQRWRALLLVIKAKLESVESGIVTFDQEFLAHIVLPDKRTYGEFAIPQIEHVYETQELPPLLPGPTQ